MRLPPSQRNPAQPAEALNDVTNALGIFDAGLDGHTFINGHQLSLGDIPTGACLYRYFTMNIQRPPLANLEQYYTTLKSKQTYRKAVMIDYSSLRGSD